MQTDKAKNLNYEIFTSGKKLNFERKHSLCTQPYMEDFILFIYIIWYITHSQNL
jgi:hypothetical protein